MAEWVKNMAKIIVSSRYVRNTPKRSAANLVRYMGTREGVEKVPIGNEDGPATVRQQRLIKDLLETDADANNTFEYQDYENNPTKQNATEFIDAFIERNADRVEEMDKLVKYMAERPSVEKLGPHGLFNQYDDKIDLDSVAEEVGQHQGVVWTHVVSLHREDAERLGYNKAEVWKDLVRRNMTELAKAHQIDLDQLQWYAAFHNTTHHPHIHLLVYSRDPRQGWLSKKGIDELRSVFGNDIFRFEQQKLFRMETELRDKLKDEVEEDLFQKVVDARDSYAPTPEAVLLFRKLASQLKSNPAKRSMPTFRKRSSRPWIRSWRSWQRARGSQVSTKNGTRSTGRSCPSTGRRRSRTFRWKTTRNSGASRTRS